MAATVQFGKITASIDQLVWTTTPDKGFASLLNLYLDLHRPKWIHGRYHIDPDLYVAVETIALLGYGALDGTSLHIPEPHPDETGLPRVY